MLKVIVRRAQWLRGNDATSMLYRPSDRRMCCLGFACKAAGLKTKEISGEAFPNNVMAPLPKPLKRLVTSGGNTSGICDELVAINDDNTISTKEREAKLKQVGKHAGLDFRFTGKG